MRGGLWVKYKPKEFATLTGLLRTAVYQPIRFAQFVCDFIEPIVAASPNPAHVAIANLQASKNVKVITQNIDGLHQRAGSGAVMELHGSIFERRNLITKQIERLSLSDLNRVVKCLRIAQSTKGTSTKLLSACRPLVEIGMRGIWLPNIVLFGQTLDTGVWNAAVSAAKESDCFVIVGTSCEVFPAAGLIPLAQQSGAKIIAVDLALQPASIFVQGLATNILPLILSEH
jgi:NAD-dependent deacetylase